MKVRIRKGVRPYGGRVFPARVERLPNGRDRVLVNVSGSTATGHKLLGIGLDERIYRLDEVDVLDAEATL